MDADRIVTLGPKGTFSGKAAKLLSGGFSAKDIQPEYTKTIPKVFQEVEKDPKAWGIVPIENSIAGTVSIAQDAFAQHAVSIIEEVIVQVSFCFVGFAPLEDIEICYAHPQAFEQCNHFFSKKLPKANVRFAHSNIDAGKKLLENATKKNAGAIVPQDNPIKELPLLEENIQDYPQNKTRFLAFRQEITEESFDFRKNKTSLLIKPYNDRPGVLYDILHVFQRHQLNLCRLESRPIKTTPWNYLFHVDFHNSPKTKACLQELHQTDNHIKILGSYDNLS